LREGNFESLQSLYLRFQEECDLGKTDLAAVDKTDDIERLAREYVKLPGVVEECAARMVRA
jgi:hypothetical protein